MEKRQKDLLRTLVGKLRRILVGAETEHGFVPGNLDRELERIGIAADGTITPIDVLGGTRDVEQRAYRIAVDQLAGLAGAQRPASRSEIIERAAYTWINRLLALRAMEARNLINSTLRAEVDYDGLSEKLYILRLDQPERASDADKGWWAVLTDACNELASALPGLFALDDPAAALRPSADALVQCIDLAGGRLLLLPDMKLAELDAAFADPDAIGWAYQFYQEDAKAAIDLKCKDGGKAATRAELAAKTQLFTEPYMVQWLLQNSLGRSYHEAYPDSQLPAQWPYYISPEQRPNQAAPARIFFLAELTLLDPCMGSGHFLRAAFDMFVDMYHEQQPASSLEEIISQVLRQHIFGIDLDPRAAQLAALTLFLRSWELVRQEQRRQRKFMTVPYIPPSMNLATTPTNLNTGMLARHLLRHPHDRVLEPFLKKMFSGLEQASILGSLLRSREYIDQAIEELSKAQTIEMDFDQAAADYRLAITDMARHDPARLRQELFDRIAESFKGDAGNKDDVSISLFGYEAERGVRLLQVLDRQYTIVVTNPPYLGSKYMENFLRKYAEQYYESGKRDLYTAFILRCLELCCFSGRIAMVTQHNWMFFKSYVDFRSLNEIDLKERQKNSKFTGILNESSIEVLAHLGSRAFEEISGEVVQAVLFGLRKQPPEQAHKIFALRLTNLKVAKNKLEVLQSTKFIHARSYIYMLQQKLILRIPEFPLIYWLGENLFNLLINSPNRFSDLTTTRYGMNTGDNDRFLRYVWEIESRNMRWSYYAKGGGYAKWAGLEQYVLEWRYSGAAIRATNRAKVQNAQFYFEEGATYSMMAQGSLGARLLTNEVAFDSSSLTIFPLDKSISLEAILAISNSRITSFFLRVISSDIKFNPGYVDRTPFLLTNDNSSSQLVRSMILLKQKIVSSSLLERLFENNQVASIDMKNGSFSASWEKLQALLHSLESMNEEIIFRHSNLGEEDIQTILVETGIPAGWFPLIANYDKLPYLVDINKLLPSEFFEYLAQHERVYLDPNDFVRLKANLRMLYIAGPGAKLAEDEESRASSDDSVEEEITSGAHIPIPTETFLEELSAKMKIHPISIYWLLEELRAEGARCTLEELRLLEDRLTVIVLRLLGHRWPKQLDAGEPVTAWADPDGIIPLVAGTGARALAELVRERLYAEDGAVAAQHAENLLEELTTQTLEQWLRTRFFEHHISQFKHRPIAWHLASTPLRGSNKTAASKGKSKKKVGPIGQRTPAFECFLYYHACTGDALARIRTQYVEPLIRQEKVTIHQSQTLLDGIETDDTQAQIARERIHELEAFTDKLRQLEEQAFMCPELVKVVEAEPLDRWSGDGFEPPSSSAELQRQEEAWQVDINDGVRVNIAPLQLAGVLTKDVLNVKDARKAIADRVRWRADERRWVREGKLPRCGWMDERVPASQAWDLLAGQRETEQLKLAQKRLDLQTNEPEEAVGA